jgi:hypothetical protein
MSEVIRWEEYIKSISSKIKALPEYDAKDPDRDQIFSVWDTEHFYKDWTPGDRLKLFGALFTDRHWQHFFPADGLNELSEMDCPAEAYACPYDWAFTVLSLSTLRNIYLEAW